MCCKETFDAKDDATTSFLRLNTEARTEHSHLPVKLYLVEEAAWSRGSSLCLAYLSTTDWNKVNVWGLNGPDRAMKQQGGIVTYTQAMFVQVCVREFDVGG